MPTAVFNYETGRVLMHVMIGVDPHKASHTAVAIDGGETELAKLRVSAGVDRRRPIGHHARVRRRYGCLIPAVVIPLAILVGVLFDDPADGPKRAWVLAASAATGSIILAWQWWKNDGPF